MCLRVSYKKKLFKKMFCILKVTEERSRIRYWIRRSGSADPDPHQNVPDPQHWTLVLCKEGP
jgi:hypothetical protein